MGCDVAVIGLGVGGQEVALRLAEAGMAVLAVEQGLVGGECPYWGCIPSKAMTRASQAIAEVGRVAGLAGQAHAKPDWSVLAGRVRRVAEGWDDARAVARLRSAGVELWRGRASFIGPAEIQVADGRIRPRRGLVIATGTTPVIPAVPGLSGIPYWTNREAIEATGPPDSLAVLGGGSVGLELGQVFHAFGSTVTIIEAASHVLPGEEPENSSAMEELLRRDGIAVRTGIAVSSVHGGDDGIDVELSDGSALRSERLLVATGRRPDLQALGVSEAGLDATAARIETDPRMRAGPRIWAVGDVTGHGQFTHVAYYQAQIAAADILGTEHEPADYAAVPRVTFTDPEMGSVGLTEAEARRRGMTVRVGVLPTSGSDRAWLYGAGADLGVIKLIEDAATGTLVGGSSIGPVAGETVAILAVAIRARIPVATLREVVYPYPTFARAIRGALRRLG
jgi:pyruvate/2-oxoglutarate dehydrogenase complex dihydrolipoamide dehydrogenase (E3) component